MSWRVEWTRAAERDLRRLDRQIAARVRDGVLRAAAAEDRRNIERLTDRRPLEWRLRVGDWRVLFEFQGGEGMRILRVLPRGRAYRG